MQLITYDLLKIIQKQIAERGKTIENYSISRVAGYVGLDRAHMLILGNFINSSVALAPSEIAVVSFSE